MKSTRGKSAKGGGSNDAILIVGYGNPLRSDDSLGLIAADTLSALPELASDSAIEIRKSHQLMPELAEKIARSSLVIFMDASVASEENPPGSLRSSLIEFDPQSSITLGHHCTPAELISFSVALFGGNPKAILVSLAAASFDYGEKLSDSVRNALPSLIEFITEQVRSFRKIPDRICQ